MLNLLPKHPSSEQCYNYAKNILETRLDKQYEDVIKKDPNYAYLYAKEVIKGRWK